MPTLITNPADVVKHIIHKEVQHDSDEIAVDMASYNENIGENGINSDIKLAFTVHDKQINSKKLIEGIASNSRLIPYIKDNELVLKGIMASPSPEDDINHTIDQSDIISYTNKRTAPEKVYSKVIVNYHYDYALKDFTKNTLNNSEGSDTASEYFDETYPHGSEQTYEIANLGLEKEQELPFDAHYIRDETSAEALQKFLLLWHCNQHNVLKLKLPLKYIQLKIGDYIGFDKLINGVKLFGEDYSFEHYLVDTVYRNGQQILPVWMITSTNKTLTHVDVEMIQMHNCSDTIISSANVAPVVDSLGFQLSGGEQVVNNAIVIHYDSFFDIELTISASDINNDELSYSYFIADDSWFDALSDDLPVTGNLLMSSLQSPGGLPVESSTESSLTVRFGYSSAGGVLDNWLQDWFWDDSIPDGEFFEIPSGMIQVQAFDDEELPSNILTSPSFRVYKSFIPVTIPVSYPATEGWQLISTPLGTCGASAGSLFPNSIDGTLFEFLNLGGNAVYYPRDHQHHLVPGKGYWLMFPSGSFDINFIGDLYSDLLDEVTVSLSEGWNFIGGLSVSINIIDDISDPNDILIPGSVYGFDGTYGGTNTIVPGHGYWIRASQDGEVTLNAP